MDLRVCASARARVRVCVCVCPYVCASVRRQRASVRLASQRHIAGQKRTVKKDRSSRSQPDTSSDTNEAFAACADSAVICCPRPMSRGTLTWEGARASPPPAGSRSPASAAAACASAAPCSSSCGQRGQGRPVSRAHGSVGVPRAQVPRGRFCFAYPSLLVSLPEATCVGRRAPRARHRARQAQLCRRQMHQHQPESVCIHLAHRLLVCCRVPTPGRRCTFLKPQHGGRDDVDHNRGRADVLRALLPIHGHRPLKSCGACGGTGTPRACIGRRSGGGCEWESTPASSSSAAVARATSSGSGCATTVCRAHRARRARRGPGLLGGQRAAGCACLTVPRGVGSHVPVWNAALVPRGIQGSLERQQYKGAPKRRALPHRSARVKARAVLARLPARVPARSLVCSRAACRWLECWLSRALAPGCTRAHTMRLSCPAHSHDTAGVRCGTVWQAR